MFWIETNPAYDEYADFNGDKSATGLFLSNGFCLIGINHRHYPDGGYKYGLIVFNVGFGIWKE